MAEEGMKVVLHLYDLSQGLARQLSPGFLGRAIEGIWHTGIVVYGNEYYYGGGIQHSPAGRTPHGKPLKVVELGMTHLPKEVFEDYLQEIRTRFTAETYSLLHHNCNNFSNELAQFLVGCNIPDFIIHLPEEVINSPMGALILPLIQQFETTLRYGGVPQVPQGIGSSSFSPYVAEHQEASNLVHNSHHKVTAQEVGAVAEKSNPSKSSRDSSSIPPVIEPVKPRSSDELVNLNAKELDTRGKAPPKNESYQTKQDESTSEGPLGDARAKVQEEITREFAILMATGSLQASEAAAIATRRVMEKYGRLNVAVRQS